MGRALPDPEIRIKTDSDTAPESRGPEDLLFSHPPPSKSLSPAARPRSIFTLRPLSHTEGPPAEPEADQAGSRRTPKWVTKWTWAWAAAAVAVLGAVPAWWALSRRGPEQSRAAIVLVNGTPQLKRTVSGALERWQTGSEVTVVIDPSIDELGPGAHEAVMNAFGTWLGSAANLPKLRFDLRKVKSRKIERDGVNSVRYAPIDIEGHKNDLAITIGFVDEDSGHIVEADVVINSSKAFGILAERAANKATDDHDDDDDERRCGDRYDLQNVVTHEAGHFFGLGEDGDDSGATMFFKTSKCELKKRDLEPMDATTVAGLYVTEPSSDSDEKAAAHCAARPPTRTAARFAPLATLLMAFGLRVLRRRR